jgi:hypothetical protein
LVRAMLVGCRAYDPADLDALVGVANNETDMTAVTAELEALFDRVSRRLSTVVRAIHDPALLAEHTPAH